MKLLKKTNDISKLLNEGLSVVNQNIYINYNGRTIPIFILKYLFIFNYVIVLTIYFGTHLSQYDIKFLIIMFSLFSTKLKRIAKNIY